MKTSNIKRLLIPTIPCFFGLIINSLVSAFMVYFGNGHPKISDFLYFFSPTIILLIFLFVAWIWQITGGILLIVAGSLMIILPILKLTVLYFSADSLLSILVSIPIILSGILFLRSHFRKESW